MKERELASTGDERVAFRFKTDKSGNVIEINELPANLVRPLAGNEE
jgi:nitrous oxide reductase accessory protein NosL